MEEDRSYRWDGKSELVHYEESDKYNLRITLVDEVLKITLTILTKGIVYGKEFVREQIQDIGKGWCDDLFDILMIFMTDKEMEYQFAKNDETRVKENMKIYKNIDHYDFGTPIQNGSSKYSVLEDGAIKIMSEIQVGKIKKKKIFQGELVLKKLRQITDRDIYEHKLMKVQRQFKEELQGYVPMQEMQVYKQRVQQLQKELKIYKVMSSFESCPHKTYFSFEKNKIVKVIDSTWTQLSQSKAIEYEQLQSRKIRILKTAGKNIYFGVMDRNNVWFTRTIYNTNFVVSYYGFNGAVQMNGATARTQGNGFGLNDVVQMEVQLSKGLIRWKVNNTLKCTFQNNFLTDRSKCFCPFIQLVHRDDTLQWLDQ